MIEGRSIAECLEYARKKLAANPGQQWLEWTDKLMMLGTGKELRIGKVNYLNRRLFESGPHEWQLVQNIGYCLAPLVVEGDKSIMAVGIPPQDGDIVIFERNGEITGGWFHQGRENTWLETNHGKEPLKLTIGVVMLNARFARLPFYDVDTAPSCQSCPQVLRLLDTIIILCRELNLDPGEVLSQTRNQQVQTGSDAP